MVSFGAGGDVDFVSPVKWPEKLTDVDAGNINITELWMIKEKVDTGNCEIIEKSSGVSACVAVKLNSGDEYYLQHQFEKVYFVRRIKSKTKKRHYSHQYDYEFEV